MAILDPMWSHESFRRLLAQLLSLKPTTLADLAEATATKLRINAEDAPEEARPQLLDHVNVVETIYISAAAQGASGKQVVEELEERSASDDFMDGIDIAARRDELVHLFNVRPEFDRDRKRLQVERQYIPALVDFEFGVDLRVTVEEGVVSLVPVAIARLEFDEAPSAGNAIAFQFSPTKLKELKAQLDELTDTFDLVDDHIAEEDETRASDG